MFPRLAHHLSLCLLRHVQVLPDLVVPWPIIAVVLGVWVIYACIYVGMEDRCVRPSPISSHPFPAHMQDVSNPTPSPASTLR